MDPMVVHPSLEPCGLSIYPRVVGRAGINGCNGMGSLNGKNLRNSFILDSKINVVGTVLIVAPGTILLPVHSWFCIHRQH